MPIVIQPDKLDYKIDSSALIDFGLKTLTPRLGEITGSKHFVFDIRQLEPDTFSFPYHFHRNAEELIMIISGSLTMRSKEGLRIINKGELVFFEMGETSVHQLYNHDSIPCVYFDIRTTIGIDVVEYPDSGKINISPYKEIFKKESQVDYNNGENNIRKIWSNL